MVLCVLYVECCGILSPVRRALGFPDAHNQKFTSARVVGKVRQGLKSRGYSRRREGVRGQERREGGVTGNSVSRIFTGYLLGTDLTPFSGIHHHSHQKILIQV